MVWQHARYHGKPLIKTALTNTEKMISESIRSPSFSSSPPEAVHVKLRAVESVVQTCRGFTKSLQIQRTAQLKTENGKTEQAVWGRKEKRMSLNRRKAASRWISWGDAGRNTLTSNSTELCWRVLCVLCSSCGCKVSYIKHLLGSILFFEESCLCRL